MVWALWRHLALLVLTAGLFPIFPASVGAQEGCAMGRGARGRELVVKAGTFARLADTGDYRRVDNRRETFLKPGTRYLLYEQRSVPDGSRRLALVETGLCVYLTDNDISPANSAAASDIQRDRGADTVAFLWTRPPGPDFTCEGKKIRLGPGEIYAVRDTDDEHAHLILRPRDRATLNLRSGCSLKVAKRWLSIRNLAEAVRWEQINPFRSAGIGRYAGISKNCQIKITRVEDAAIKIGGGLDLAYGPAFVKLSGDYSRRLQTTLELGSDVNYQEKIFVQGNRVFYFVTKTPCPGRAEYRFEGNDLQVPVFLSVDRAQQVKDQNKADELLAKYADWNPYTGQYFVSCPQQQQAGEELLNLLGAEPGHIPFILAQVSVRDGRIPVDGKTCR